MAAEDGVVSGHAAAGGGVLAGGGPAAHGGEEEGGREGGWRSDNFGGVACEYHSELDGPFG